MQSQKKGLIFNIQRFSIHDGQGIRTTVFLKGCPLTCPWCSNPESINSYPEMMLNDTKCILCRRCVQVCNLNAITIDDKIRKIDTKKCNLCLECANVCLTSAITRIGEYKTVEEVLEEVIKDEPFYKNSCGGITLSGGEPLYQAEFTYELLKRAKEKKLHTALDTTGYCNWQIFKEILQYVDLLLYDIKHMDSKKHEEKTAVDNKLIIENLKKAAKITSVWIRLPIIPSYNDDEENIIATMQLAKDVNAHRLSLLPYHEWGKHKYNKLNRKYLVDCITPPQPEQIEKIKNLNRFDLEINVGG